MFKLTELINYDNYWLESDGNVIKVKDHVMWIRDNVKLVGFHKQGEFLFKDDGNDIATEEEVYDAMFKLGYVRVIQCNGTRPTIVFNYDNRKPPNNAQLRSLRDMAIENGVFLHDANKRRDIDLE
jgi:hypothetical protein